MGNSNGTPMNSVPDREPNTPLSVLAAKGAGFPVEVAVSPDARPRPDPAKRRNVPCVFRWEEGGQTVFVSGDWDNFASKRQLVRSKSAHTVVLEVPPGPHRFRFEVDGRWAADTAKPLSANVRGEQFNLITAEEIGEFAAAPSEASCSPPGDYSQDVRDPPPSARAAKKKNPNEPPMLPPHLLRALLNTAPNSANPLLLPLPHHVMLNHLYINRAREKDAVSIYGITCRCRSKFVTTVLYTRPV